MKNSSHLTTSSAATATALFRATVLTLTLAGTAQASLLKLNGLFNTGVDGAGAPLDAGVADPHYTLLTKPPADPSPGAVAINHDAFPVAPSGPWLAANATSRWIGAAPGAQAFGGTYVFRTSFNIPAGADPGKVSISGIWSADDPATASIAINGNPAGVAPPTGFGAFSPEWTISSGFVPGVNYLDFSVPDTAPGGGGCCMGLRLEIQRFSYDIGLYNTGVDSARLSLADNTADSHWSIISGPTPGGPLAATSAGGFPIGPWLGDNATSTWITPTPDTVGNDGLYQYETTFDLSGVDPSTFSILGQMSVDNDIFDILLNGVSTGESASGFGGWAPFALDAAGGDVFNPTINTLTFLVNNGAPPGPTGLRVEFLEVNGLLIPEPSSGILFVLGGMLLLRRRR